MSRAANPTQIVAWFRDVVTIRAGNRRKGHGRPNGVCWDCLDRSTPEGGHALSLGAYHASGAGGAGLQVPAARGAVRAADRPGRGTGDLASVPLSPAGAGAHRAGG